MLPKARMGMAMISYHKSIVSYQFIFLLILLSVFGGNIDNVYAQCPKGNVILTSQIEVEEFTANFPLCGEFFGSLTISGNDIQDLSSFEHIWGVLDFYPTKVIIRDNPSLVSLSGMTSLFHIQDSLQIINNDNLENLDGLYGLIWVGTYVQVEQNPKLMNLNGLCTLMNDGTFSGELLIKDNVKALDMSICTENGSCPMGDIQLRSQSEIDDFQYLYPHCKEFSQLNPRSFVIAGDDIVDLRPISDFQLLEKLEIKETVSLEEFDVFSSLLYLNTLVIQGNEKLLRLPNFSRLTELRTLVLFDNDVLENIEGLATIKTINNSPAQALVINEYSAEGEIVIWKNPALSSLNGLQSLSSVKAFHIWENASLRDLSALEKLIDLEILTIHNNPKLESLQGLKGLESLQQLIISQNLSLSTLSGLENLAKLDHFNADKKFPFSFPCSSGSIISKNASLTNLSGLSRLDSVFGDFSICENDALGSFRGLDQLRYVGGELLISNCTRIMGLEGFSQVETVGRLTVHFNNNLRNLDGLDSLQKVDDYLMVSNNPGLRSLEGIGQISSIGNSISIHSNPNLTDLSKLCNIFDRGFSGQLFQQDNGSDFDPEINCGQLTTSTDIPRSTSMDMNVYPNPTKDFFHFTYESLGQAQVNLLDTHGRIFLTGIFSKEKPIDVSHVPNGLYFVRIEKDKRIAIFKLVVKHS